MNKALVTISVYLLCSLTLYTYIVPILVLCPLLTTPRQGPWTTPYQACIVLYLYLYLPFVCSASIITWSLRYSRCRYRYRDISVRWSPVSGICRYTICISAGTFTLFYVPCIACIGSNDWNSGGLKHSRHRAAVIRGGSDAITITGCIISTSSDIYIYVHIDNLGITLWLIHAVGMLTSAGYMYTCVVNYSWRV